MFVKEGSRSSSGPRSNHFFLSCRLSFLLWCLPRRFCRKGMLVLRTSSNLLISQFLGAFQALVPLLDSPPWKRRRKGQLQVFTDGRWTDQEKDDAHRLTKMDAQVLLCSCPFLLFVAVCACDCTCMCVCVCVFETQGYRISTMLPPILSPFVYADVRERAYVRERQGQEVITSPPLLFVYTCTPPYGVAMWSNRQ